MPRRRPRRPGRRPARARALPPVWVIGYPGSIAGASTELWHTLKLWRRFGLDVRLCHTWGPPPSDWRPRCDAIGCSSHAANPNREELAALPDLAGGLVVSFCNAFFLQAWPVFHELGCRIAWVNCMNWIFPEERKLYPLFGPFAAYACQSRHQIATLGPILAKFGVPRERIHHTPGAFDPAELGFAPRPRKFDEPYTVGRVSRHAPNKFSTNTWRIWDRVDVAPKRYRILGWSDEVARHIGAPPPTAQCLEELAEPLPRFLGRLHGYCQIGGTDENYPRTGLEAMAAGVPIVAQAAGGWPEQILHGETGFLAHSDAELAHWMAHLAYDDDRRLAMARRARDRLADELAEPTRIWNAWKALFESIA